MKDYSELAHKLRVKESRDNRALLDEAADAIDELSRQHASEFAKYLIDQTTVICTRDLPDFYHDFMEAAK